MTRLRTRAVTRLRGSSDLPRAAELIPSFDRAFSRGSPRLRVVDAHAIFGQSLAFAFRLYGIRSAWSGAAHVETAEAIPLGGDDAGFVILDLSPESLAEGVDVIRACRRAGARVLVITDSPEPALVAEALLAGAEAVSDKAGPFDELVARLVVRISGDGSPGSRAHPSLRPDSGDASRARLRRLALDSLTARERHVLGCLMDGQTVDEIARDAAISVATVRSHVHAIFAKLGVHCQLAAVAFAHSAGWLPE